jgi:lysyl-tRNA synthetase class 1
MPRSTPHSEPHDWVTRAADEAIRHHEKSGASGPVTCSSGASPSGRVHLGNLREFLMPHFVADELRRRGVPVRHLHVWDDYDRFRKVPAGVDPSWADHIGRPLSAVPDPWECHATWAEHFKEPLIGALHELGVDMEEISQTERYRSGVYREQVLHAVRHRADIGAVLDRYRTKKAQPTGQPHDQPGEAGVRADEAGDHAAQEAEAMAESVANDDEDEGQTDVGYFPFKPYCRDCGRDTTTVTAYDDDTTDLAYTCSVCDYHGTTNLATQDEGKLVWKADWPMRWAFEHVDFEPAGMDHATPGSSFTVGHELVESVWDYPRPAWFGYGFVGFAGVQKMSSSAGGAPTAEDALRVLEPGILRWLYVRRQPKQTFDIEFGPEVVRLYDEWDALGRKAADPEKRDVQVLAHERAAATQTAGALPAPVVVVPFRMLSSVADVTAGSAEQISRIVNHMGHPHDSVDQLEPRLSRAVAWTEQFVPESERTTVRSEPDVAAIQALSPQEREWLSLLLQGLQGDLELEQVTSLVYGVPKLARGLSLDEKPTDEVKADQKEFFRLLYHLLVDAERGPRLPTLIVALGADRVRSLLGA